MISARANTVIHQVALVRPGRSSLLWLGEAVRACQGGDRLAPVTAVAPTPYSAAILRRSLAASGCANVRLVVQLRPIAERVGRAGGARGFDQPLSGPLEAAAIRLAVREAGGADLQPLADHRSLQETIGALFRDLGHLDNVEPTLASLAAGGHVAAGATRAYGRFTALTAPFPDVPAQLRLAAEVANAAPANAAWIRDLGALVVYLPPRLDAADVRLLGALGRHMPIQIALAHLSDAQADGPVQETADALARSLGVEVVRSGQPEAALPEVELLSAPDPDEEGRAIVRRLVADLESGVPLWRMAVLHSAEDPYGPLVRESLDAAGLPWHGALGRPAAAGWAARSLLGLIGLRDQRFAREAVLEWLVGRPPSAFAEGDPLPDVPISAWDRLSRRAQVLDGAGQWIERLQKLTETLEREEQQREDWRAEARGHESVADTPRPPSDSQHARAMAEVMRRLDRDTRPPAEPATWDAMVDWASRLRLEYVHADEAWPSIELSASNAVDEALESLRGASEFESTTTIHVFRDTLAAALEARRLPEGEAGVGVLVGPLGSAIGSAFDRAYIMGTAEGLLPSRPAADPLAMGGAGDADPLRRRERQRQVERAALLGSLAGADGGRVVLSYARSDGAARASHPSRWLLEQAARLEGLASVYASELSGLFGPDRQWLERVASAFDGLQRCRAPVDLADRRVRRVIAWHALGQDLARHPLALRPELPLGRALHAARARRSRAFTEYDGNLGAVADHSRLVLRPFTGEHGASAATALERGAGCPFQYMLAQVLRVEATERPEDEWTRGRASTRRTSSSFTSSSTAAVSSRATRSHPPITIV
jgi:ATP-dependent helicase/nuclease subunit B